MQTRRVTFCLYPSLKQEKQLHYWRSLHKLLYNACLYQRTTEYRRFGKSVSYYNQQNLLPKFKEEWPEYKALGSQALQATVKRVDYAFSRFFKGLGKYPRYKSIRIYRGWTYPSIAGWNAHTIGDNGILSLSNLAHAVHCLEKAVPARERPSAGQIQMRGKART